MKISYKDFNLLCRLCLNRNDFSISVLQENVVTLLNNLGVRIQVNEVDELPQNICSKCEKHIDKIFTFIAECKKSYIILESILSQEKKIKNESEKYNGSFDISNDIGIISNYQETKAETIIKNDFTEKNSTENSISSTNINKFEASKTNIACGKCNILLKTRLCLNRHYKKNIECRPLNFKLYKCEHCDKEFLNLRDKTEHRNIHTGETPYKCTYCIKEFKFKTNLHKHIYRHKLKLGLVDKKESYREKRVKLKLKCNECEKVFASRSGFQQHKLKHEGKILLRKHEVKLDKNVKDYLCNYCAMSFYIKANLDTHLRVHTGERPYKCTHCDQQFKQKSVLDRHTLNHLDVRPKPFVCDVCQKSFTTKAHMEIHRRLHTGERPYECHFCQKCFNYRTRWRIHLRMHTGESPFICEVCNNSYYDKGSLRKHQRKKGHISNEDHGRKLKNLNLAVTKGEDAITGKL